MLHTQPLHAGAAGLKGNVNQDSVGVVLHLADIFERVGPQLVLMHYKIFIIATHNGWEAGECIHCLNSVHTVFKAPCAL